MCNCFYYLLITQLLAGVAKSAMSAFVILIPFFTYTHRLCSTRETHCDGECKSCWLFFVFPHLIEMNCKCIAVHVYWFINYNIYIYMHNAHRIYMFVHNNTCISVRFYWTHCLIKSIKLYGMHQPPEHLPN